MRDLREAILSVTGNLRDFGGLPTRDGRSVRRGLVYRSAAPSRLAEPAFLTLRASGLRRVVDFRSQAELASEIAHSFWRPETKVWRNESAPNLGDPAGILEHSIISSAKTRAVMTAVYARMPLEQASSFGTLFAFLAREETPLLFHCAAGKDRTGVAAAILLLILGVPDTDIIEDYMMTNSALEATIARFLENPANAQASSVAPEIWRPMMLAEEAYLATAFKAIRTQAGDVEPYLRRHLGLSEADIERIRNLLLA